MGLLDSQPALLSTQNAYEIEVPCSASDSCGCPTSRILTNNATTVDCFVLFAIGPAQGFLLQVSTHGSCYYSCTHAACNVYICRPATQTVAALNKQFVGLHEQHKFNGVHRLKFRLREVNINSSTFMCINLLKLVDI